MAGKCQCPGCWRPAELEVFAGIPKDVKPEDKMVTQNLYVCRNHEDWAMATLKLINGK